MCESRLIENLHETYRQNTLFSFSKKLAKAFQKTNRSFVKTSYIEKSACYSFFQEVIQPQVLLRLPCYDLTLVINLSLDTCLLSVGSMASA